jgi:hypothetical protein
MNNISFKIGYWSAISLAITFIIWIASFAGIALTSPLFTWTNLSDYVVYFQSYDRFFQNLAYVFMLFSGPLFVLLLNGYHAYAAEPRRVMVRIGLQFALAFAVLSGIHYFVQLSSVRHNLLHENFDGLELFLQANPDSITNSFVMLGWTLFLGLSSFFMFPVFRGSRLNRILRIAFLFNGFSCMAAGIGYVLQIDVMTFFFVNIGTGGALMVISVASVSLFGKLLKGKIPREC